jgi:hypothetical protein
MFIFKLPFTILGAIISATDMTDEEKARERSSGRGKEYGSTNRHNTTAQRYQDEGKKKVK